MAKQAQLNFGFKLVNQQAPTVTFPVTNTLSTNTIPTPMVINMTNKPIGDEGRDKHGRNVTNFMRKCTVFTSLLICEGI
jgi:hypothetical protein